MKTKVVHDFYDKENDLELRKAGEEYDGSKKRGNYLISFKVAKEIKEQKGGDPKSPAEA